MLTKSFKAHQRRIFKVDPKRRVNKMKFLYREIRIFSKIGKGVTCSGFSVYFDSIKARPKLI